MASTKPLVLSGSEYKRLKNLAINNAESLNETSTRISNMERVNRRERLHQKSLAETSQWSSTIEGNRLKRLAAKAERQAKKEEEMKKIDLEEERYQAEQRKTIIAHAEKLVYEQDDRVKTVRQADLLSEVLRERESQKHFSKHREQLQLERDRELDRRRIAEAEEEIRMEAEKRIQARIDATNIAGDQLNQALQKRAIRKAQRQVELAEQASLTQDAVEFGMQEQQLHRTRRDRNSEFVQGIEEVQQSKKALAQKYKEVEELEDIKNAEFNDMRDKRGNKWKADAISMRKQRQERIESLAKTITGPTAEDVERQLDEKNQLIMEEKHRKEDEEEALKAYKRGQEQKKINMYLDLTREQRMAQKRDAKVNAISERRAQEEEVKNLAEQERTKMARIREANIELKNTHRVAAEEKREAEDKERQSLVLYRQKVAKDQEEYDAKVQEYAMSRRDAAKERGCTNMYALDKAVGSMHPTEPKDYTQYLPTVMTRKAGNPYPGNSKKRMGFIY